MAELDPEKVALWKARIEEQRASGMNQAEYCRRNNITENQFSFWKGMVFPVEKKASKTKKRKNANTYSPYEQKRLIQKWKRGGLTQSEFCRRENIFQWQLSEWKRRIERETRETAQKRQASKFVEIRSEKASGPKLMPTAFSSQVGQPDKVLTIAKKVVAEIRFSGGTISIFSDACMADVKNIFLALMECGSDRIE